MSLALGLCPPHQKKQIIMLGSSKGWEGLEMFRKRKYVSTFPFCPPQHYTFRIVMSSGVVPEETGPNSHLLFLFFLMEKNLFPPTQYILIMFSLPHFLPDSFHLPDYPTLCSFHVFKNKIKQKTRKTRRNTTKSEIKINKQKTNKMKTETKSLQIIEFILSQQPFSLCCSLKEITF